jgi:hypothetical protein
MRSRIFLRFTTFISIVMMTCTNYLVEGTVIVLPLAPTTTTSSSSSEKKNVFPSRAAGFGMEFIKGVRYMAELIEPTNGDIYLCGDISGSDGRDTSSTGGAGEDNSGEVILQDVVTPSHHLPGLTMAESAVPGG